MEVIYMQFMPECEVNAGVPVRLGDMVHMVPADEELAALTFDVPSGGRRIDAVELAARVAQLRPEAQIEVLGGGDVFVSRRDHRRGPLAWILKICLILLLFGGAALGITFFHADVNMLEAQQTLCGMFGAKDMSALELAWPYSIGLFMGVGAFFLLGGRNKSPLALKLQDYRKQLEQADAVSSKRGK